MALAWAGENGSYPEKFGTDKVPPGQGSCLSQIVLILAPFSYRSHTSYSYLLPVIRSLTPSGRWPATGQRRDELDPELRTNLQETRHIWRATLREDRCAFGKKLFKPAWSYDNPMAAGSLSNVLKCMDHPARGINDAARRQRLSPFAVGQESDTAFNDEEHLVLIAMAVRGRAAARRGAAQRDDHRAVCLRTAQLDLRGVAVGVDRFAAVRRDDEGFRRKRRIRERGGIG
jgi:hypothetical protein